MPVHMNIIRSTWMNKHCRSTVEHRIKLTNKSPIKQKPYVISYENVNKLKKKIKEIL